MAQDGFGVVLMVTRLSDSKQVAVKFIKTEKISHTMWLPDPRNPNRDLVPPASKQYTLLITELHGSHGALPQSSVGPSSSCSTLLGDESTPFDLFECIRTQHHLAVPVARKVAVRYVQTEGIVHRDMKDVKIVIDSNLLKIKIIDLWERCLHSEMGPLYSVFRHSHSKFRSDTHHISASGPWYGGSRG
ncbi:hypothetical protein BJ741DRAFT_83163 [Chytriomyces cf. hyalinus JEL632]|nr:hypothetical protein BJ741DRAFT_83163 [Chytriomyces cf. hyalinus JEL632]